MNTTTAWVVGVLAVLIVGGGLYYAMAMSGDKAMMEDKGAMMKQDDAMMEKKEGAMMDASAEGGVMMEKKDAMEGGAMMKDEGSMMAQ